MSAPDILRTVSQRVRTDTTGRRALTLKYPRTTPYVVGVRRFVNNVKNSLDRTISRRRSPTFFTSVIARHSSPLYRKLGDSDPRLQIGKVRNLELAIEALQGLVIEPGETFSFWSAVGNPTKKKGYINGMLLSGGKVSEGVGGGLCQLSNLLYWLFLHTPLEVVERKHHSVDVFPDSGRTIPFGTGATIYYNLIDLKVKNTTEDPFQLKLWLSEAQLKGQILSTKPQRQKYHLLEKMHHYVGTHRGAYRYNEIWKETLMNGEVVKEEKVMTNCSPVLYPAPRIDLQL
jgi:vancomycin resistance protein VanW